MFTEHVSLVLQCWERGALRGPYWADTIPPARKLLPDEEMEHVGCLDSPDSPLTLARTSHGSEGQKSELKSALRLSLPVQAGMTTEQMVALSPAKKSVKMTDYSRAKISEMSEHILDLQTTEYYKWGESFQAFPSHFHKYLRLNGVWIIQAPLKAESYFCKVLQICSHFQQ